MSADFRFPESLKRPPRPFVGLTGLDTTHNAIHRTIWEAFEASKKEDRKRLAYKLFELDHIYPKPSRPDFVVSVSIHYAFLYIGEYWIQALLELLTSGLI